MVSGIGFWPARPFADIRPKFDPVLAIEARCGSPIGQAFDREGWADAAGAGAWFGRGL